ncbi:hypothetical protein GPECTOR_26g537 [Gonium pectorale]|uniref:DUF1264-domain-containing protein n=1 Tax=Gonium pectorale TaxID=33097 RepID=A0A150GFN9_GONPE|nr:hypothetical protein GPECTOR_26g537 [Gonium pectorale]|eukprot:KXZ48634.1 hypothetical protein GPECTOR_26g537 [Gonium pectorale]
MSSTEESVSGVGTSAVGVPSPATRDAAAAQPPAGFGGDGAAAAPAWPDAAEHQDPESLLSAALDAGCSLLQSLRPVKKIHQHVCAFHMYSHDATRPVRAHHFCAHRSGEMRQCVLYDSNAPDARPIGIEYIISRRPFEQSLPQEVRKYWHSHVYEVDRGDPLPLGPPQLMMAYTADGQLPPDALAQRDREEGVDSAAVTMEQVDFKRPTAVPAGADAASGSSSGDCGGGSRQAPAVPLPSGREAAPMDTMKPGGGGSSGGAPAGGPAWEGLEASGAPGAGKD